MHGLIYYRGFEKIEIATCLVASQASNHLCVAWLASFSVFHIAPFSTWITNLDSLNLYLARVVAHTKLLLKPWVILTTASGWVAHSALLTQFDNGNNARSADSPFSAT